MIFKKEVSPKLVSLVFGVLVISFLIAFYVFAWTPPSQLPPGGNVPEPLNVGSTGQSKAGGLVLNTGGAVTGLVIDQGYLQIAVISGAPDSADCDSNLERGRMILDHFNDTIYICSGDEGGYGSSIGWKSLSAF